MSNNQGNIETKNTITQNYEVSIDNIVYEMQATVRAIEIMKAKGEVTEDLLKDLASELTELKRAINLSGKEPSQAVINVILDAEASIEGLEGKRVPTVQH